MKSDKKANGNNLIIISKQTVDSFLKQKNAADVIALYTFYCYTAIWQATNQIRATTGYAAKGLHLSVDRVRKAKSILKKLELIEDVRPKDHSGRITKHYIKIKYLLKRKTREVYGIGSDITPEFIPSDTGTTLRSSQQVVEVPTNSLSDNNKNSLSDNNKNALSDNNINALNEVSLTDVKDDTLSTSFDKSFNQEEISIASTPQAIGVEPSVSTAAAIRNIYSKESDEYIFADILLNGILKKQPTYEEHKLKKPAYREKILQRWAKDFNMLIRIDGKDPIEICDVLEFAANDNFWWQNIMSGSKFREKYERLIAAMRSHTPSATLNAPDPNPELTQKLIRMYARLISNKEFAPNNVQNIKFIEASRMAKEFYEKRNLIKDNWIRHLENCMYDKYINRGETLQPGHLSGNHTWSILMPQYLAELG